MNTLPSDQPNFHEIVQEIVMENHLDLQKVGAEIGVREGEKFTAYRDSLGYSTVGKGHLITQQDIIEVGDTISKEHSDRLFTNDLLKKLGDCRMLYSDFDTYPISVQEALLEMMFNIGVGHLASYGTFNNTVKARDWASICDQLRTWHLWISQVGQARVDIIIEKFRAGIRI